MGNTSASFHLLWRGDPAEAGRAIGRAYDKLGWEKSKKASDAGRTVKWLARAGEPFVSVYDSAEADLDSGALKDAALLASKALKTGAAFTSIYDSDTYEFVVFANGRQVDLAMSDVESYAGPMKRLDGKPRAKQWGTIFGRAIAAGDIERAAAEDSAFAEASLSRLAALIGLPQDRPLKHYGDLADPSEAVALHFVRKATARPPAAAGEIRLENYYDKDNSRKLLVYPGAWPMPLDQEEILTWLLLSRGAGFAGGEMDVEVGGPEGLTISSAFMNGANFHNGQIVGGYELAKNATMEEGRAYLDSKRFSLEPVGAETPHQRRYASAYPNLSVPPMTPTRSTQILIVLQFHVTAAAPGEWTLRVRLRPGKERTPLHELPPARIVATRRTWLPIVTGLNPRATYDPSDLPDGAMSDSAVEAVTRRSMARHMAEKSVAEARAELDRQFAAMRAHNYKNWLRDVVYQPQKLAREWRLESPAITANVAILADRGAPTLANARSYLEDWLRRLAPAGGEVRAHAERRMTASLSVGKVRKSCPAAVLLADKAWAKFFAEVGEYQSIVLEYRPERAEFPVAGCGLAFPVLDPDYAAPSRGGGPSNDYAAHMTALTLGKMRGRDFTATPPGRAAHVHEWAIDRPEIGAMLMDSAEGMAARLDAFATASGPLQAWHCASAWIPRFDTAGDFEGTVYEDLSALNFFRGVLLGQSVGLKDRRMSEAWCANVLRMAAPTMWLGAELFEQLDRAALERVARVSRTGGTYRIEKREDRAMEDLELALLPILPIESRRVTIAGLP
jgi:hypothetical protein